MSEVESHGKVEKEADKNHVGLKEDRQGTPKNRKKQTGGGYKSYNHRCNNHRCNNHRRNYHRKNHQHNEKGHEAEKERDDDTVQPLLAFYSQIGYISCAWLFGYSQAILHQKTKFTRLIFLKCYKKY